MSEINHQQLAEYLDHSKENQFPSTFLIYGEEFLYKAALDKLLNALLPESNRNLNYEPLDGDNENLPEAIERVNTYSLLTDKKVIVLCDSRIFYSQGDSDQLYDKAKRAFEEKDMQKAVKYFINYLAVKNLNLDDVSKENRRQTLNFHEKGMSENEWLDKMIRYCMEEGASVSSVESHSKRLQKAIEKGFPKGNYLIITADLVDKRRALYKTIKEKGIIVDCAVPKGLRKADQDAQNVVLNRSLKSVLSKSGKTMGSNAYMALCEMTGFDLRTFTGNIEKLVSYVGDRTEITVEDVEFVLKRTKIDPIFELTNAISDRNIEKALFFLASLISAGFHPLQILAAMANQIRKLLLCRSLIDNRMETVWHRDVSYGKFKSHIIPIILEHDKTLLDQLIDWDGTLRPPDSSQDKKKKGRKPVKAMSTDLFIAKNPNNPYPIYKVMLKSNHYTIDELMSAMEHLNQADRYLKTSAHNQTLILEKTIINIC